MDGGYWTFRRGIEWYEKRDESMDGRRGRVRQSSVPAERVLSGDGGRDEGSAARVVHAASATALAVAHVAWRLVVAHLAIGASVASGGKVAAEERTAHQRGAAGLAHLRGRVDRAGALVSLLLALVAAGNDEHGGTVRASNSDTTHGNSSSGALLLARLVARGAGSKCIIRVARGAGAAGAGSIRRGRAAAVQSRANENVNGGVDLAGHVVHERVGVGVQGRRGNLVVQSQQLNRRGRDVQNRLRRDESKLCSRVIGNDALHRDIVSGKATIISDGLGKQRKQLSRGHGLLRNPFVVEAIVERNLDRRGSIWLGRGGLERSNRLGESRGNARRGG